MAIPIFSAAAVRGAIVASSDEAIALTRATEIFQADTFIASALMSLQNSKPVLERFAQLSQISSLISKRSTGSFSPISVAGLESTEKSAPALRNFFNLDGPVLGETLTEANTNYAALLGLGIQIVAPVSIPVLIELDNKDGKPPVKSIGWYSSEQIASISAFPINSTSVYPGSISRVRDIKNSDGKVIQTTRYTVFEDYANRRPSMAALAEGLSTLTEMVNEVIAQVAVEMKFAQRAGAEADRKLNLADEFKNEIGTMIQKIDSATEEIFESAMRLVQLLHRERQLLMIRQDEKDNKAILAGRSDQNFHQILNNPEKFFSGFVLHVEQNFSDMSKNSRPNVQLQENIAINETKPQESLDNVDSSLNFIYNDKKYNMPKNV